MNKKITFGAEFRRLRKKHGKTLREVSSHVGVTVSHLSDIENGKKRLSHHKLGVKMLQSLGLLEIDEVLALDIALAEYTQYMMGKWWRG